MDEYFLYNRLTRMYYFGFGCSSRGWTTDQCKLTRLTLEDATRIRKMHLEKWGEPTWIVRIESLT